MFDKKIYIKRRRKLALEMVNNSVALIEASSEKIRNNDVYYKFRQSSNFFYLTGFDKPNAFLMLIKKKNKVKSVFCSKKPNKHDEIWTGKLLSSKQIMNNYGFDACDYFESIEKIMRVNLEGISVIYHSLKEDTFIKKVFDDTISNLDKQYRKGVESPSQVYSLKKVLHKLRLVKDKDEIKNIRKATDISSKAHVELMKRCKPGLNEKDLEAGLIYNFNLNNATEAYTSIVASGKNACILHYIDNSSKLKNGDLLLTDAACEFNKYASDITRTIPINGKFSKTQKIIYQIVLSAQEKAIAKCYIGNTLKDIHNEAVKILCKGLIEIGLLKVSYKEAIKSQVYKKFYMHNTGHWMGLDVHDPCDYMENEKPIILKEGMVFTVEPGIYIRPDKSINKKYHNIGIRIEDDVLITKNGPEVLTAVAPKQIKDIEKMMSDKYV